MFAYSQYCNHLKTTTKWFLRKKMSPESNILFAPGLWFDKETFVGARELGTYLNIYSNLKNPWNPYVQVV